MACSISYIDDFFTEIAPASSSIVYKGVDGVNTQLQLKNKLYEIHNKAMNLVLNYNEAPFIKIEDGSNSYLVLNENKDSRGIKYSIEQQSFINSLGNYPIKTTNVVINGIKHKAVTINALEKYTDYIVSNLFSKNTLTSLKTQNEVSAFDPRWSNDISLSIPSNAEQTIISNNLEFLKSIDKVKLNIISYIKQKANMPEYDEEVFKLKRLLEELENPNSVTVFANVKSMIDTGMALFDELENDRNRIPSLIASMKTELADMATYEDGIQTGKLIGEIINNANSLHGMMSFLKEYSAILNNSSFDFLENYNTYKLLAGLSDLKKNGGLALPQADVEILLDGSNSLQEFKDKLYKISNKKSSVVDKIFKDAEYQNYRSQFAERVKEIDTQIDIATKDYSVKTYEYLAELLYPQVLRAYQAEVEADAAGKYNFPSKAEFVQLLKVAKEDIGLFNKWIGSGLTYNDVFVRSVSSLINEQYREYQVNEIDFANDVLTKFKALGLPAARKKEIEDLITVKYVTVDHDEELVEATSAEIAAGAPVIELVGIDGTVKQYLGKEKLQIVNKFNTNKYDLELRLFNEQVDSYNEQIYNELQLLLKSTPRLGPLDIISEMNRLFPSPFISEVIKSLTYIDKKGVMQISNYLYKNTKQDVKSRFNSLLYVGFSNYYKQKMDSTETVDKLRERGLAFDNSLLSVLNNKDKRDANYIFMRKNINQSESPDRLGYLMSIDPNMIMAEKRGINTYRILINTTLGHQYLMVTQDDIDMDTIPYDRLTGGAEPIGFYYKGREFTNNKNTLDNSINGTTQEKDALREIGIAGSDTQKYHDFVLGIYNDAKNRIGGDVLKYQTLSYVQDIDTKGFYSQIKNSPNKKEAFAKAIDTAIMAEEERFEYAKNDNGEYLNKNGVVVATQKEAAKISTELYDAEGVMVRRTRPRYIGYKPVQNVERDLFINFSTFATTSMKYELIQNVEDASINVIRILKGDNVFGLKARTVVDLKKGVNDSFFSVANIKKVSMAMKKTDEVRSTDAMIAFIENFVFYEPSTSKSIDKVTIGGKVLDMQKISKGIKGLGAFQYLSFNIMSPISNFTVGATNNIALRIGGQYGITNTTHQWARKKYWSAQAKGDFLKDFGQTDITKLSKEHQIGVAFQFLKGDMVNKGKLFETNPSRANGILTKENLFLTVKAPEHALQHILGLSIMKGFILGKDASGNDVNFYDVIKHTNGQPITYDFSSVVNFTFSPLINSSMSQEQIEKLARKMVTEKVEGLQRIAHGTYAEIDKTMAERHAIISNAYMFAKWTYPFLKARFGARDFDWRIHQNIERGYYREFFKGALSDIVKKVDDDYVYDFTLTNIAKAGLKTPAKTLAAMFDYWTDYSKTNADFEEFLLGSPDAELEIRRAAHNKLGMEMSYFMGALLLGLYAASILDVEDDENEEDDDTGTTFRKWLAKLIEIQSKRYVTDMGLAINPLQSIDFMYKKITSPFVSAGAIKSNGEFFGQLLGFKVEKGEGFDFDIDFSVDEKYDRSGNGYSKGDYKVIKKLKKSAFSPLGQIERFLDLETERDMTTFKVVKKEKKDEDEEE